MFHCDNTLLRLLSLGRAKHVLITAESRVKIWPVKISATVCSVVVVVVVAGVVVVVVVWQPSRCERDICWLTLVSLMLCGVCVLCLFHW